VGWSGRAGARGCCPAALAPGCEPAGDERDYLVRWSSDGRTWYDAALVRQPSTGGSNIGVQELHAIATHGELLVAAGGSWQRTRGDFAAVAFTSSDGGRTWNWSMCDDGAATTSPRLDCSAGGTGGADSVVDVASDGTSLFATGVAGDSAAFWQARRDPSLPGGLRWSQVAPPADLPSPSRAYAVAPSGGGWVVGVRTGTGAGPFEARLYRYDAGRWSESGRDAGPEYREVSALAVVDRTVVAVGQRGDDAVTWRSDDDGRTWSSTSAAATSGLDWLYNVQARPGGFVAVGTSDGVGLVVTSVDGRSWVPLEPLEAIERAGASEYLVRSVVVLADGARAVATAGGADGSVIVTPLVWR
ncbi:MAG: hypothetical protein OEY23_24960, partial [Acidimicrobiia bacterium]|nr:hypothetical protein [Acidimicrobiia bacterium]